MNTEYEIAFLNTPHDVLRKKISSLGGKCIQPRTLMRRVAFRNPLNPSESFARIRDEGERITCTYKEMPNNGSIDSVKEIECEVSDFESMRDIFIRLGIPQKSYQETYRETWKIGQVECMLDEWPGLKPFIEIEGPDEASVRSTVDLLGFHFEDGFFGGAGGKYAHELGIPREIVNNLPEITFENPPKPYAA